MLRTSLVVILGLSTGAVIDDAHASLTLTINTLTTDEFSFTLAGTFDADVIGDQTVWLAIKNDWSNNFGLNTDWIDSSVGFLSLGDPRLRLTVVENSVTFNGSPSAATVVTALDENPWGDSFYFDAGFAIPAGTVVAGTLTVTGTNVFDPSAATALQLLSGFDNAALDWVRLEAEATSDINASFHLGGGSMLNFGQATGWRFTPTTDILLTKLGLWDEDQDGLAEGHDVGIFEVANPGMALATAFIDSSDPLRGDSRFEAVASLLLSAGTEYYLLANNFTMDRYVFGDGNVGFAPEINWLGFTDGTTNDIFSDPVHFKGLPGDLGPNFQFIPGPGGLCPWDLDSSGSVGTADLLDLLSQWGTDPGGPPDFDGGGSVGTADLLKLLSNWGACPK